MDKLPGVSIIIPNYNYAQFLGDAIGSALDQDHPDCEVIVVDDCSTDSSRAVIDGYFNRVRTVFLPENRGQVAAINAAWPLNLISHLDISGFGRSVGSTCGLHRRSRLGPWGGQGPIPDGQHR